jgi:phage replication-related protein YjqB (UPF0714/DUF867 family)
MTDKYSNFRELSQSEKEGADYRIEYRDRGSRILVMAIHGGKIERGTTEIAYLIAGADYSFYSFLGIKSRGNKNLHIVSRLFDEPRGMVLASSVEIAVSIHGHNDTRSEFVLLGGLHEGIIQALNVELIKAGYEVRFPNSRLGGVSEENICNMNRGGRGVQIEITRKLRERFEDQPSSAHAFADTVRGVLSRF